MKQPSILERKQANRVLVVAAHPDDEMLGLEGTLIKHRKNGDKVDICLLSGGRGTTIDQLFDSEPLLRWVQLIEKFIGNERYNIVYTHWNKDRNKDHRIASEATTTALRPWIFKGKILFFETPDGSVGFSPNYFVPLTDKILKQKQANIKNNYEDELEKFPHPRSIIGLQHLACFRGMQCGQEYAEAFEVYHVVAP